MQHYLDQLITDLLKVALAHKQRPSPLDHHAHKDHDDRIEAELEQHFAEVDRYIAGDDDGTMYTAFGLPPEAFPPADRLTDVQLTLLNKELLIAWAAFNTFSDHPAGIPDRILYPELLGAMKEPYYNTYGGATCHQDYCYGEPTDCPWPQEFCRCKDFGHDELLANH